MNMPSIDRAALMRRAHQIARQAARTYRTTARRSPTACGPPGPMRRPGKSTANGSQDTSPAS